MTGFSPGLNSTVAMRRMGRPLKSRMTGSMWAVFDPKPSNTQLRGPFIFIPKAPSSVFKVSGSSDVHHSIGQSWSICVPHTSAYNSSPRTNTPSTSPYRTFRMWGTSFCGLSALMCTALHGFLTSARPRKITSIPREIPSTKITVVGAGCTGSMRARVVR